MKNLTNTSKQLLAASTLTLLAVIPAQAGNLELPAGMGGVPDIGAIPCNVFTEMLVVGGPGTKLSLLTWADGYLYAKTNQSMDEIVANAEQAGESWNFDRITDHFESFCENNPDAITKEAVQNLAAELVKGAP